MKENSPVFIFLASVREDILARDWKSLDEKVDPEINPNVKNSINKEDFFMFLLGVGWREGLNEMQTVESFSFGEIKDLIWQDIEQHKLKKIWQAKGEFVLSHNQNISLRSIVKDKDGLLSLTIEESF